MQSIEQEQSETGTYVWGPRFGKCLDFMIDSKEKYVRVIGSRSNMLNVHYKYSASNIVKARNHAK